MRGVARLPSLTYPHRFPGQRFAVWCRLVPRRPHQKNQPRRKKPQYHLWFRGRRKRFRRRESRRRGRYLRSGGGYSVPCASAKATPAGNSIPAASAPARAMRPREHQGLFLMIVLLLQSACRAALVPEGFRGSQHNFSPVHNNAQLSQVYTSVSGVLQARRLKGTHRAGPTARWRLRFRDLCDRQGLQGELRVSNASRVRVYWECSSCEKWEITSSFIGLGEFWSKNIRCLCSVRRGVRELRLLAVPNRWISKKSVADWLQMLINLDLFGQNGLMGVKSAYTSSGFWPKRVIAAQATQELMTNWRRSGPRKRRAGWWA